MPRVIEGGLSAAGLKFAIVSSRFNALIVDPLVGGAIDAIVRTGGAEADITHYRCPGAYELPQVVRQVAAIIALGAVIRGSTPHFDYVAGEAAKGIAQVAAQADIPIAFGVLTTDTIEQALERAGTKAGNKGFDAAMTAIETARLFRLIRDVGRDGRGRSPA
jgi:6,7-dimethyl-8-ribityllumazine synthase